MRTAAFLKLILVMVMVWAPAAACKIGAPPATQPAVQVETAVAQTLVAQQALTPLVTQVLVVVTATAEDTIPPPPPTEPLPASPAVELPPSATDTPPGPPMVSVTVDTNCRYGPAPEYHTVGSLLVGQTAQVFGKNTRGDWWYIENLKRPGEKCWLWGQYAQIAGEQAAIAVATPPPVYFTVSYSTHADCEGLGGVDTFAFTVRNIGTLPLESATVSVVRKSDGMSMMNAGFPFAGMNAPFRSGICGGGNGVLAVGDEALISVVAETPFDSTPARTIIRLCTQDGLGGTCYERTVDFTI